MVIQFNFIMIIIDNYFKILKVFEKIIGLLNISSQNFLIIHDNILGE
jgi:hypothetical protein